MGLKSICNFYKRNIDERVTLQQQLIQPEGTARLVQIPSNLQKQTDPHTQTPLPITKIHSRKTQIDHPLQTQQKENPAGTSHPQTENRMRRKTQLYPAQPHLETPRSGDG
jgi:hypothetical protein